MNSTRVLIKHVDGTVDVIDQSHAQLCETLEGAPTKLGKEFWNGEKSVVNGKGETVKILTGHLKDKSHRYIV